MPFALDDFDSNCRDRSVIGLFDLSGSSANLGQHSRGGLHCGGEVKPQLRASREEGGANPKKRVRITPTKPPCMKGVEDWLAGKAASVY